uniref:Uncharacterized protein n=1 Tax=Plectus sambesii TaxID=2011161 RepID=A0A914VVW7_9BILA
MQRNVSYFIFDVQSTPSFYPSTANFPLLYNIPSSPSHAIVAPSISDHARHAANERPDRNEELERLAALREQLLERSKRRPNDFKGTESEIQKEGPAPVPDFIKDQIRERLESRVSNDTSSTSIIMPQDRSGYITDVSSATWQFSSQSFSPRSVVSINGGTKDDSGLLKVRTDLSPGSSRLSRTLSRSNAAVQTAHMESVQMPQAPWPYMPAVLVPIGNSPASTMTREFNESYSRKMERYNSLPVLDSDDKHSTLIKIQDENRNKPRSIMKRRELETKEQMLFSNGDHRTLERPGAARHWQEQEVIRTQPSVTETVQKFEESKRTEEVERRVSSKQKEKKHRREHRSSRHRHHDQAMIGDYPAWTSPMVCLRRGGNDGNRSSYLFLWFLCIVLVLMSHMCIVCSELQATRTLSTASEPSRSVAPPKPPVRIYQQRAYTAEDLNLALKQAYQAVEEADRIVRNSSSRQYHTTSRSQQRSNGYQPAAENYYRSSTTKRLRDQSADDYRNGGGLSHARYGSLSDSLRRGELKYIPNGDIRERHSSHSNGRVHKSISNRDVFHGDMHDDRSYSSFRAGPIVEFPPTLPRGGAPMPPPHRNGFGGNQLSKSRSYADWDDGKGWGSALRRYDDDMTRLESEFQDSLLMPLPNGQNMHEKDYREEKLPGGYESLQREVKSNAGRRLNRDGNPTQFNESKQEYNYKRETESDRRR